jgi:tetratricopeptide (TPR) repeat protein
VIALAALVLTYAAVIAWLRVPPAAPAVIDPMSRDVHAAERALVDGRLAEAQALTARVAERYPGDPFVSWLTATIAERQGRWTAAAAAWSHYAAHSSAPELACPAVAEAFEASGAIAEALARYQRCAEYDGRNSDRLADWADALARQQRADESLAVYVRASRLDPRNARVNAGIRHHGGVAVP